MMKSKVSLLQGSVVFLASVVWFAAGASAQAGNYAVSAFKPALSADGTDASTATGNNFAKERIHGVASPINTASPIIGSVQGVAGSTSSSATLPGNIATPVAVSHVYAPTQIQNQAQAPTVTPVAAPVAVSTLRTAPVASVPVAASKPVVTAVAAPATAAQQAAVAPHSVFLVNAVAPVAVESTDR